VSSADVEATTDPEGSVLLAYVHPGGAVQHSWHVSVVNLLRWDALGPDRIGRAGGPLAVKCGTDGLPAARNESVRHFLDSSQAEWLWLVDTDMGFTPDALERLVDAADPAARPVVGALCFGLRLDAPDGYGGYTTSPFPVLYEWAQRASDGQRGFAARVGYEPDTVMQVAGTGAACLLVHRSAAAAVRKEFGDRWFDKTTYADGTVVSEDLSFCWRLAAAGQQVFVHTGVRTTHAKAVWLGEDDWARHLVLGSIQSLPAEGWHTV